MTFRPRDIPAGNVRRHQGDSSLHISFSNKVPGSATVISSDTEAPTQILPVGQTAHKCFGEQHRFDVEVGTGHSLPDWIYRLPDGVVRTAPAGTKVAWPEG